MEMETVTEINAFSLPEEELLMQDESHFIKGKDTSGFVE